MFLCALAIAFLFLLPSIQCEKHKYPDPDLKVCGMNGQYSYTDHHLFGFFHVCTFTLPDIAADKMTKICAGAPSYSSPVKMGFRLNEDVRHLCPNDVSLGWELNDTTCYLTPFWRPRPLVPVHMMCNAVVYNQLRYFWKGHDETRLSLAYGHRKRCRSACHFPSDPTIDRWRGCTCHSLLNATNCEDWFDSCNYFISRQIPSYKINAIPNPHLLWQVVGGVVAAIAAMILFPLIMNIKMKPETFLRYNKNAREKLCCCFKNYSYDYAGGWIGSPLKG